VPVAVSGHSGALSVADQCYKHGELYGYTAKRTVQQERVLRENVVAIVISG